MVLVSWYVKEAKVRVVPTSDIRTECLD